MKRPARRRTLLVATLVGASFVLGATDAGAADLRDWACVHVDGVDVGACLTDPLAGLR